MLLAFESLLKSHAFSDFRFSLNKETFLLHKGIIVQRSHFFRKLFEGDQTLPFKEMGVPEDLTSCFPSILKWLYCSPSFRFERDTVCKLGHLAVIFEMPGLLQLMAAWLRTNLDYSNVLRFYADLLPLAARLPPAIFSFMNTIIESSFELLDSSVVAQTLPFQAFVDVITNPKITVPTRALAIVSFLIVNYELSDEQKSLLVDLYLRNDWIVGLPKISTLIPKSRIPDLIQFAAGRLSVLTDRELLLLQQDILIGVLSSDRIDAFGEDDLMRRFQNLTSSTTLVNKHRNRKIWMCLRDSSSPRDFSGRVLALQTLKCLVLGSAMAGELSHMQKVLVAHGLSAPNVLVFNGDRAVPETEFLFHFDVVFAFTHYQFASPKLVSDRLARYVRQRRGGLVLAYGFMRSDEWGCGDGALLEMMPTTRGNRGHDGPVAITVEDDGPFAKYIRQAPMLGSLLKADVSLRPNGKLIAAYEDGNVFMAYADVPAARAKIVALNCYPAHSEALRPIANPHPALIAEAVKFASGMSI
jgi:hypothetical protein